MIPAQVTITMQKQILMIPLQVVKPDLYILMIPFKSSYEEPLYTPI